MRKILFTVLASCWAVGTTLAQGVDAGNPFAYAGATPNLIESIDVDVHMTHPAGIVDGFGNSIPAGSTTYRVYVNMLEANDFVTAVGAQVGCSQQILFSTTGNFFNSSFGGEIGQSINPAFFGLSPSVQFDTWYTFGADTNAFGCGGNQAATVPPDPGDACALPSNQTFGTALGVNGGVSYCRTDGGFYTLNAGNPCGFGTGAGNRVLIGQFTTAGTFNWQIGSVTVIENGVGGQGQEIIGDLGIVGGHPIGCAGYNNPSINAYYEDGTCIPGFGGSTQPAACIVCVVPPACVDAGSAAYDTVVANDDFCCITAWDSLCQTAYDALSDTCAGCTDPNACNYNPDATEDDGSCVLPATPPACVDVLSVCYSDVLAADSFCCETAWDSICQTAYDVCSDTCAGCMDPTACNYNPDATEDDGSCIAPATPAACVDVLSQCYLDVLAADSFCCEVSWDGVCQAAYDLCSTTCLPCVIGAGCGVVPPACVTDCAAWTTVITNDSFCCNNSWDSLCQSAYDALNGSCLCVIGAGCGVVPPACVTDCAAWTTVITNDSFCCNNSWDSLCQSAYDALNGSCLCVIGAGCGVVPPACVTDCAAWTTVITNDSFCCNNSWDSLCQSAYDALNGSCLCVIGAGCGVVPPACVTDCAAWTTVITNDTFCCNSGWDSICQSAYDALNGSCLCVIGAGCGVVPPACVTDCAAWTTVITNDTFCCNSGWDSICQSAYDALSASCIVLPCAVVPPACATDAAAVATVQANDSFCCDTAWDAICQAAYDAISDTCAGCMDPNACNYNPDATEDDGSCILPATPPVCVDVLSVCYSDVLAADSFCCETAWDSICQAAYDACSDTCAGCMDPNACNYNPDATEDDGSCILPATPPACVDVLSVCYSDVLAADSFCCDTAWDSICQSAYDACSDTCEGCTDSTACNYDANVVTDNNTCTYPGCTDITACNYDALAGCDDLSCVYPGCTNVNACNYDALAGCDDGSCILPATPPACVDVLSQCYLDVLAADSFCCEVSWDSICQAAYDGCSNTCIPVCITPPACVDVNSTCYADVIAADSFCCVTAWDSLCQNAYDGCSVSCTGGLVGLPLSATAFPTCIGEAGATSIPGATDLPSNGPFGGDGDDDVVYAISIPCDGALKVRVDGTGIDAVVELFDGASNFISAVDATLTGDTEILFENNLSAGNYFVRVYDYFSGVEGAYTICATYYCASEADFPYYNLTYDACGVYKCNYLPLANGYEWSFVGQNFGQTLTATSPGNYTFLPLNNLSGLVIYGETYDVFASAVYTDVDLGTVVASSPNPDPCVMNAGPSSALATTYQNGTFQLSAQIKATIACGAEAYVFQLTPDGGGSPLTYTATGTTFATLCNIPGILPGQTYTVEIAVVYNAVQYAFGTPYIINTAPYVPVMLRAQDNCANAGAVSLGYIIWTNANRPCSKDYTWEFTPQSGGLAIYKKKGNGIRTIQLGTVPGLIPGETYIVRVKAEYGNFTGFNGLTGEPEYDYATAYGASDTICLIGPAAEAQENNGAADAQSDLMGSSIYPNPASEFFNVSLSNVDESADKVLVDIYDSFGKLIFSEQFASQGAGFFTTIGLNGAFAGGVYMVNITVNETTSTQRLTIVR